MEGSKKRDGKNKEILRGVPQNQFFMRQAELDYGGAEGYRGALEDKGKGGRGKLHGKSISQ